MCCDIAAHFYCVKKFLKPFDKFPVVKFFKIIYHTSVTMFLLSLAKPQLL